MVPQPPSASRTSTAASQGYASPFLTHMVGRPHMNLANPDREKRQFEVLGAILRERQVAHRAGAPAGISSNSIAMDELLSSNEMFSVSAVCFCDIPLNDLGLHMGKYGRFGLVFQKRFAIAAGASPVSYLAKNAFIREVGGSRMLRAEYFDKVMRDAFWPVHAFLWTGGREPGTEDQDLHTLMDAFPGIRAHRAAERLSRRLGSLDELLSKYVLGYLKCFDDQLADDDPNNFYLEREWRAVLPVRFELPDLAHVVVPRAYAARLLAEHPGILASQVKYAEDCVRQSS